MYDQTGRQHSGPLVGREEELGELYAQFAMIERLTGQEFQTNRFDVLARRPYGVFLLGEAGVGKTRLAEEMARWAQQREWMVIWHRAYEQERVVPYWLWSKVLRACLQLDLWRPEEEDAPAHFLPLARLLPELAERWPAGENLLAVPPEQEPFLLWEAALSVFRSMSRRASVLLVLDDAQWADEGSCKLLGYLLRRLPGSRVLMLGTCRQEELSGCPLEPLIGHLQRERLVTTQHVRALPDEQVCRLLSAFSGRFSPTVIQRIQRQAAGNPFFAEELARSASIDAEPRLPQSIAAALSLRLERLSPACQRLLSKAAVLGGSFDVNLIGALEESLSPRTTDGKKPHSAANEDMFDLLEEALQAGILTETGTGAHITFSFWHPLMVTHLYENLSAARRTKLHRHVARVLQQVHAERLAEQAAIITHHLLKADASVQDIIYYAELAGDHAYALSSYHEAEKHYRIALEHLPHTSTLLNADGRLSDEQVRRFEFLELLGECMRIQGKDEEARRSYEQALHLRGQQIVAKNSEAHQQEAQIQALLWCEIGWTWYDVSKHKQALQCYCRGEEILQEAGIIAGPVWAYIRYHQGYVSLQEGMYEEAQSQANEALSLFDVMPEQLSCTIDNNRRLTRIGRILARDPIVLGRTHALLGLSANGAGKSVEALHQYNIALTLYEQKNMLREIAGVCCNLGDLHLRRAEYELAQANLRRSLNLAERVGDAPLVPFTLHNLGILNLRLGNLADAETECRQSIDIGASIDDPIFICLFYTYLGSVLLEQGNLADTGKALSRALSTSRAIHIMPCIGHALVAVGEMRIAQAVATGLENGDKEDIKCKVDLNFKRARKTLEHAEALEEMEAETRTEGRIALGQLMFLQGDIEAAQQLTMQGLEEAYQFELTWLIARAQRILGSVHAAQEQTEQAVSYFEQALRTFRKTGMRLEYARTLHQYGEMLVQQENSGKGKVYQRGMGYLCEACEMFEECGAMLDLRVVENMLGKTM